MSLATRCTACGTVFRVVQDQLRVSAGWVRCGRCGEVFNAVESLVDVAPEVPEAVTSSVHGSRVMAELARVSRGQEAEIVGPPAAPEDERSDGIRALGSDESLDMTVDAGTPALNDSPVIPAPAEPDPPEPASAVAVTVGNQTVSDTTSDVVPAFVLRAKRNARWRHPAMRVMLLLMSSLAAAGLAAQAVGSHHDWIAARWPSLQPAVASWCQLRGCVVRPPRHLQALAVESSSLVRPKSSGHYLLTVALRNRATWAVRIPALDLVLSDAEGKPALRRVLLPVELGLGPVGIEAGQEMQVAARLQIEGQPVLGYTVELFYP